MSAGMLCTLIYFHNKVYFVIIHTAWAISVLLVQTIVGNARALKCGTSDEYRFPRFFFYIQMVFICIQHPIWESIGYYGRFMDILLFNTRDELIRVSLKYVVYLEADDNFTHIHFSNGAKVILLLSLSKIEQLIDKKIEKRPNPFIRIGKRYIVNSSFILQINTLKRKLILTCFDTPGLYTLSVSKEALKNLKDLYGEKLL